MVGKGSSTVDREWIYEGRGAIHPDSWFDEYISSMKLLRKRELYMTLERNHRVILYQKHALAKEPLTAFDNYTDEIIFHIASYLFGGNISSMTDDMMDTGFITFHAIVPYARDFRLICHRLATTFTWKVIAEDVIKLSSFESLLQEFNNEKECLLSTRLAESYYQLTKSDFSRYHLPPTKFEREKCYFETDLLRAAMIKFDHSYPKLERHGIVRKRLKEEREEKIEERERLILHISNTSQTMLAMACCMLVMSRSRS